MPYYIIISKYTGEEGGWPVLYSNGYFYSGFYELNKKTGIPIDDLMKSTPFDSCYILPSKDKTYPCPYEDSDGNIFLHGSCNLFAIALRKIFGYTVYEVCRSKDLHWFCKTMYKGQELYIDARGATSDFNEFSSQFSFIKDKEDPLPKEISDSEIALENEEWKDTGMLYAVIIISEHKGYYGDFDS